MSRKLAKFPSTVLFTDLLEDGLHLLTNNNERPHTLSTVLKDSQLAFEDGDAVAVYKLDHVYEYRSNARLEK